MREFSKEELTVLISGVHAYVGMLEHVMRYHVGGYTTERRKSADAGAKLLQKLKDMRDGKV